MSSILFENLINEWVAELVQDKEKKKKKTYNMKDDPGIVYNNIMLKWLFVL